MPTLSDFLSPQDISELSQAFGSFLPPEEFFQPVNPEDFSNQAQEEVGPFFDKSLDLAIRNIERQRQNRRDTLKQQEEQQAENLGVFESVNDRAFARTLRDAQGGFSARNLGPSGIRRRAIGEIIEGNEQNVENKRRGARQATEQRELGFEQFLKGTELQEEGARLTNRRQKLEETARRQSQLASQEEQRRAAGRSGFQRSFDEFLQGQLSA